MKKIYFLLAIALIGFRNNAQTINIPDANFKAKLLAASPSNTIAANGFAFITIDTNNNNEIEVSEALQVTNLNVSIAEIYDITGIESFANLRSLNCSQNHIPSLNVSTLTNLKSLYCSLNLLSSLDLTGLTHLLNLECAENVLIQINFADATSIQNLSCRFNFLTALDVNSLSNLQSLNFDYNQLTTVNLSNLTQLTDLGCQSNQFLTLDLSSLVNLISLNCSFNQLSTLDLNGLNTITTLNCSHNLITTLDLTNLTNLSLLNCEANQISNPFVLSSMSNLQSVYCQNNLIPSFTFNELPSLEILDCSHNQVSDLDVSTLPFLSLLNCYNNTQLVHLNIKNGSNETFLDFSNNQNLLYVCADEGQLTTVQNLIIQYGYTNCQVNTLCNLASQDFDFNTYFSVSPNPAKQLLNIVSKATINMRSIAVYNILDQIVITIPNAKNTSSIDVAALKTGTYFIKISTDKGSANAKFVKE